MSIASQRAIYGKLAGDSTLTNLLGTAGGGLTKAIYYQAAPQDSPYPFVIFQKQAGTPHFGFNSTAPLVDEMWLIKGVDKSGSSTTANGIIERVKTLLTDANLSISGVTTVYLRWESDVDYSEIVDGERVIHAGALFRLTTT